MRNLGWMLVFIADGVAFVLAVYKVTHKQWSSGVLLALIGLSALSMSVWSLRSAARLDTPLDPLDYGRIVMRATSGQLGNTLLWAVGFLGVAIGLAENPQILWTRWLSYPAALVALLLAGVVMWAAKGDKLQRFVADSHGFDTRAESPDDASAPQEASPPGGIGDSADRVLRWKIAWSQVGAVKRVETRPRITNSRRNSTDAPVRRELIFLDHDGQELLRIDDGLDPPERYKLFLESIPRWTGLEVKEEHIH
jgi:hypothetical protein